MKKAKEWFTDFVKGPTRHEITWQKDTEKLIRAIQIDALTHIKNISGADYVSDISNISDIRDNIEREISKLKSELEQ